MMGVVCRVIRAVKSHPLTYINRQLIVYIRLILKNRMNTTQEITACAFIWHEFEGTKKVFIAKRADTKKFLPGVYELPGGHIEFGENIIAGLKREILEEFGANIEVQQPFYVFDYVNDDNTVHTVEIIYYATLVSSPEDIKLNPSDHSASSWISQSKVSQFITMGRNANDPEYLALLAGFNDL